MVTTTVPVNIDDLRLVLVSSGISLHYALTKLVQAFPFTHSENRIQDLSIFIGNIGHPGTGSVEMTYQLFNNLLKRK